MVLFGSFEKSATLRGRAASRSAIFDCHRASSFYLVSPPLLLLLWCPYLSPRGVQRDHLKSGIPNTQQ